MDAVAKNAEVSGFSKVLPLQPLHWDASRLRLAQQCWRKHYYATCLGLRSNFKSPHQEFGSLYHSTVEEFDLALLAGFERETAIDKALQSLLAATWNAEAGEPWGGTLEECFQCTSPAMRRSKRARKVDLFGNPDFPLVANRERCQWAKAPSPFMPLGLGSDPASHYHVCGECGLPVTVSRRYLPFHPKKHRVNLVRAFLLYADTPETVLPYKFPNGTPAVELNCRVPLPLESPDGSPYELVANLDSLVTWEGELAVRERKTTGMWLDLRYWRGFDLDPQIDTYELVAWTLYADDCGGVPPRVLVEAMRIGTNDVELRRMPVTIPEERREEWFDELQAVIIEAEERARQVKLGDCTPEAAFPRNSSACIGPYGPCQFLRVCTAGQSHRAAILAEHFHEERWEPTPTEETSLDGHT